MDGTRCDGRFVIRHQKILPQEEVQFARREYSVFAAVIHRMDHHEQIGREFVVLLGRVFLDLRDATHHHAVFDRKRMKMKNVLQHRWLSSGVGFSRSTQRNRLVSFSNVGIRNISMSLAVQPALSGKHERSNHSIEYLHAATPTRESILLFEAREERSAFPG